MSGRGKKRKAATASKKTTKRTKNKASASESRKSTRAKRPTLKVQETILSDDSVSSEDSPIQPKGLVLHLHLALFDESKGKKPQPCMTANDFYIVKKALNELNEDTEWQKIAKIISSHIVEDDRLFEQSLIVDENVLGSGAYYIRATKRKGKSSTRATTAVDPVDPDEWSKQLKDIAEEKNDTTLVVDIAVVVKKDRLLELDADEGQLGNVSEISDAPGREGDGLPDLLKIVLVHAVVGQAHQVHKCTPVSDGEPLFFDLAPYREPEMEENESIVNDVQEFHLKDLWKVLVPHAVKKNKAEYGLDKKIIGLQSGLYLLTVKGRKGTNVIPSGQWLLDKVREKFAEKRNRQKDDKGKNYIELYMSFSAKQAHDIAVDQEYIDSLPGMTLSLTQDVTDGTRGSPAKTIGRKEVAEEKQSRTEMALTIIDRLQDKKRSFFHEGLADEHTRILMDRLISFPQAQLTAMYEMEEPADWALNTTTSHCNEQFISQLITSSPNFAQICKSLAPQKGMYPRPGPLKWASIQRGEGLDFAAGGGPFGGAGGGPFGGAGGMLGLMQTYVMTRMFETVTKASANQSGHGGPMPMSMPVTPINHPAQSATPTATAAVAGYPMPASLEAETQVQVPAMAEASVGGKGRASVAIDFKRIDNESFDNIVVPFTRCQKETLYDLLTSPTSELDKESLLDIPESMYAKDVTLVITLGDNHQNGRKLSLKSLKNWTIEYLVDDFLALSVEPCSHITAWISFEEKVKRTGNVWRPPSEETEQG